MSTRNDRYVRGSRVASLMPLFIAAAMMGPVDLSGPQYRSDTPEETERRARFEQERIEAAKRKRERKSAKRLAK